ncbi:MAG: FAD-dependent 5-carboxymethylaminomethyl-2-thiouridine(34) oxidoreductase MnmC [Hyphomonadaceae bacterium]|nr:FAD-dependent 5-carboxymethylaminomethyl-2-thiouridine(34) oxidoreductase MnmC [Hyphomonadaceae bacterium]
MRLPPRPELTWKEDGTPVDPRVGDVYYSVEDGLAETRAVFLAGCGLPDRWQETDTFTIAELGFGTGLNFLATWQIWRAHRDRAGWLHFVSFEGYPLDAEDVERALLPWPELSDLADRLIKAWPPRAKGVRQLVWPEDRLTLTLHVGLIEETLPQSKFRADAWFLDGFSPAKNDAMWDPALWPLIAERSAPGAKAATFTVAGAVRRGLTDAGFDVEKRPGHGRKRERLEATFPAAQGCIAAPPARAPKVAIIGAGIAGACLARRLTERGALVTVFDSAEGPAQGTSGNPLALVMPRLDAGDTAQARLLIDAYLSAQAFYAEVPGASWSETVQRPRNTQEQDRFQKVLTDPPLGLEQLEAIQGGGLLHKRSLILSPADLLPALLSQIDVRWGQSPSIDLAGRRVGDGQFDAILLAAGWQIEALLEGLDLTPRLGQVEFFESQIQAPANALACGHYALANDQLRLWGATFANHDGGPPEKSDAARTENTEALDALAPYWQQETKRADVQSRAGVRATTADRLPLIGPAPNITSLIANRHGLERQGWQVAFADHALPGVFIAGGYGSRGFTWAPWAADILTAQLFGDPIPARAEALQAIVPNRQVVRKLKRGQL